MAQKCECDIVVSEKRPRHKYRDILENQQFIVKFHKPVGYAVWSAVLLSSELSIAKKLSKEQKL